MKLVRAACGLAAACAALAAGVQTAGAVATGRVHVEGTTIVNADGSPMLWHGVQDGGMVSGDGTNVPDACGKVWVAPPLTDATDVAADGFNVIRLGVSWANAEPNAPTVNAKGNLVHAWNTTYLAAIDQQVQAYTAAGVDVILELQQSQWSPGFKNFVVNGRSICEGAGLPGWLYPGTPEGVPPGQAKCRFFTNTPDPGVPGNPQNLMGAFWKMLAHRYISNGFVIGADILNEPGWPTSGCLPRTPAGADLGAFFQREAKQIRAGNAALVVIYEEGTYSNYVTRGFLLHKQPKITNAVYSWHYYPPDASGQQGLQDHVDRANAWNMPFWVGELNAFEQGRNRADLRTDPNWQPDTLALMSYLKAQNVGWSFWAYRPDPFAVLASSSLIDPNTGLPKPDILAALQTGM
jgi:hypothetical protein